MFTYTFHDPELEKLARVAHDLGATMALTYLSPGAASVMVNALTTTGAYLSLHNSTGPGTTGANEIAANSASGYTQSARPSVTWGTITNGVVVSNNTQTYTMGASWSTGAIGYFGIWSASSAGTYLGGGTVSGLTSVAAGANVTITSAVTLTVAG